MKSCFACVFFLIAPFTKGWSWFVYCCTVPAIITFHFSLVAASPSTCHPPLPFLHPSLCSPPILVAVFSCGLGVSLPLLSLVVGPPSTPIDLPTSSGFLLFLCVRFICNIYRLEICLIEICNFFKLTKNLSL